MYATIRTRRLEYSCATTGTTPPFLSKSIEACRHPVSSCERPCFEARRRQKYRRNRRTIQCRPVLKKRATVRVVSPERVIDTMLMHPDPLARATSSFVLVLSLAIAGALGGCRAVASVSPRNGAKPTPSVKLDIQLSDHGRQEPVSDRRLPGASGEPGPRPALLMLDAGEGNAQPMRRGQPAA